MAKTLIDLDEELVEALARRLGTTTKKATVNTAMRELLNQYRRDDAVDWLLGPDAAFLAEADTDQGAAWGGHG